MTKHAYLSLWERYYINESLCVRDRQRSVSPMSANRPNSAAFGRLSTLTRMRGRGSRLDAVLSSSVDRGDV